MTSGLCPDSKEIEERAGHTLGHLTDEMAGLALGTTFLVLVPLFRLVAVGAWVWLLQR